MKNFKSLFICAFVITTSAVFSQTKQKTSTEVFEYVAAEFDMVSQETVLKLKNTKGDIVYFHYSPKDQTKVEEILFTKPTDPTTNSNKVTKTELIGHKYKIGYGPIGVIDPANPYCCYKIVSLEEVDVK